MTETMSISEYFAVTRFQYRTTDILEARVRELQRQRENIPFDAENYWEQFDRLTAEIRSLNQMIITLNEIWAEMVAYNERRLPDIGGDKMCAFASRRDGYTYLHSHDEILEKYGSTMKMCERMPDVLSGAMGNQMYTALFDTLEEVNEFIEFVHTRV